MIQMLLTLVLSVPVISLLHLWGNPDLVFAYVFIFLMMIVRTGVLYWAVKRVMKKKNVSFEEAQRAISHWGVRE